MSERRSPTSTLLVVLLGLAVLGALAGFALLDRVGGDEAGSGTSEGGLPDGFEQLPEDVFFERVYGAQRSAGSWALHQEDERGGQPIGALDAETELTGDGTDSSNQVSQCCTQDNELVRFEIRVVDGVYYTKGFPSEKPWWKVDPEAGAKQLGIAQSMDPYISQTTDAEDLQSATESITLVGPDSVDGVETVHYRAALSPTPPEGSGAQPLPEGAEATIDFWVDGDNRPVQVILTLEAGKEKVVKTSRYSRYGEDFDIAVPPAGQTTTKTPQAEVPQGQGG